MYVGSDRPTVRKMGSQYGVRRITPSHGTTEQAEFFSAEDPERLRGPQFHAAWADEVAAWRNQQDVWDMLQFTLRLGKHPQVMYYYAQTDKTDETPT